MSSEKLTCNICLDVVREKENVSQREFGLLDSCQHVFCIDCIKDWRRTRERRTTPSCPVCRSEFKVIVPCRIWPTEERRAELLEEHIRTANILCEFPPTQCPQGTNCPHNHVLPTRRRRRRSVTNVFTFSDISLAFVP